MHSPAPDGVILTLDAAPSPGVMDELSHVQFPRLAPNQPLPLFAKMLVIDTVVAIICPPLVRAVDCCYDCSINIGLDCVGNPKIAKQLGGRAIVHPAAAVQHGDLARCTPQIASLCGL